MVCKMKAKLQTQIQEPLQGCSRVIAVTSGKGGVGKTNLAVGLASTLAKAGYGVVLLDGDLGMANIDILMDINARYNLGHVINGEKALQEIILDGPYGLKVIPGGSGIRELADLEPIALGRLCDEIAQLEREADYLFIDTGAGISKQVMMLLQAAEEILLVTTPEPTALTDAYGLIKVFHRQCPGKEIKVIINMVKNKKEGELIAHRLTRVAESFLGTDLEILGYVHRDPTVPDSMNKQKPFVLASPRAQASVDLVKIASQLGEVPEKPPSGIKAFFNNLSGYLNKRL